MTVDELTAWPPDRRAQLNAHVAKLQGWDGIQVLATTVVIGYAPIETGQPIPRNRQSFQTPKWADGVRETWDLLRDYLKESGFSFMVQYDGEDAAIQVCLEWCRWKGEEFRE